MIRKFYATKDNTISNAFKEDLVTRATGSNMGASDILEAFTIFGQADSGSVELSRFLLEFPITEVIAARAASQIPASGSVSFHLKLFNAAHSQPVPRNYALDILPISSPWQEGFGLDMENYEDITRNQIGSSWINAQKRTAATATIAAATPGSLSNAATFTLTNAAGTTTTYRINGGRPGSGTDDYQTQPGGTAGATIDVFFFGASTVAHVAEAITKAINATTNANMTATDDGTNVTVTQTTVGITGNRTNTDNSTGLGSVGNFAGAVGEWTTAGGDFHSTPAFSASFETGLEDIDVDVSRIVEEWIKGPDSGGKSNYGFGIKFTSAFETEEKSFYTKRFFGRDTQFYFSKPVLEARWNSAREDDRGCFYASSSLASGHDNLNTLYLYNRIRGRLRDIPVAPTSASLRTSATSANLYNAVVTKQSTGIYKADLFLDTTSSTLNDVWWMSSSSGIVAYHTGTISVKSFFGYGYNPEENYFLSMPGLKKEYRKNQTHRLNLYIREQDWSPNIHTVAVQSPIPPTIIHSASYQLRRSIDDYVVIPYGTGSTLHTSLSYDVSGNYFDLDTSCLEEGYMYEVQYSFYDEENGWEEQPYRFKFRVVD
jgi:hypothetical protein